MTFFAAILFVLVTTAVLLSAAFNPIPRKIGFRNIRRRWANTLMVVVGSMVGSALISGSLILSDSLDATMDDIVIENFGERDLSIVPVGKERATSSFDYFTEEEFEEIESALQVEEIDGVLPLFVQNVSPRKVNSQGEFELTAYGVNFIALDFDQLAQWGEEPLELMEVEGNEVLISPRAASALEAEVGDALIIPFGENSIPLTIAGIAPQQGFIGGRSIVGSYDAVEEILTVLAGASFFSSDVPEEAEDFFSSEETLLQDAVRLDETSRLYTTIHVSAQGSEKPKNYDGEAFSEMIGELLASFDSARVDILLNEVKDNALDGFGFGSFANTFLVLSLVGILAGVLLIVNMFSMLAEERKTEMGILRAIAFTRLQLMASFVYEGFVYSIFSSILGSFVGVGLGVGLVVVADAIAGNLTDDAYGLRFAMSASSLFTAFVIGYCITLATSLFASWRVSNLNIVEAIRKTSDYRKLHVRIRWVAALLGGKNQNSRKHLILFLSWGLRLLWPVIPLVAGGVMLAIFPKVPDMFSDMDSVNQQVVQGYLLYFGVVFIAFWGGRLVVKVEKYRSQRDWGSWVATGVSLGTIIFTSMMTSFESVGIALNEDAGVGLFFLSGLFIVASFVTIVVNNSHWITQFFSLFVRNLPRAKQMVRIALRYPGLDRGRTGLSLMMFSVVIYLIMYISPLKATISHDLEKQFSRSFAGSELVIYPGETINQRQIREMSAELEATSGVEKVDLIQQVSVTLPEYRYGDLEGAEFFGDDENLFELVSDDDVFLSSVSALSESFRERASITLDEISPQYENEEAVWEAIAEDSSKVVLGVAFSASEGYGPQPDLQVGDVFEVQDRMSDQIRQVEAIGQITLNVDLGPDIALFSDIVTTPNQLQNFFSDDYIDVYGVSSIIVDLDDSQNEEDLTREVARVTANYDIEFILSVREISRLATTTIQAIFSMMQGFLAFSLVVGTCGLAIIMMRAVQERRQQIGMLRSLGFQQRQVWLSFFIEASFISLVAIIIGVSMGTIGALNVFDVVYQDQPDAEAIFPWGEVVLICSIVYLSAMLFVLFPSMRAARLSPVEATNYPE